MTPPDNPMVSPITINFSITIAPGSSPELVAQAMSLVDQVKAVQTIQITERQEWVTEDDVIAFFRGRNVSKNVAGRIWAIISLQANYVKSERDKLYYKVYCAKCKTQNVSKECGCPDITRDYHWKVEVESIKAAQKVFAQIKLKSVGSGIRKHMHEFAKSLG